jgi:hypothetical protein
VFLTEDLRHSFTVFDFNDLGFLAGLFDLFLESRFFNTVLSRSVICNNLRSLREKARWTVY